MKLYLLFSSLIITNIFLGQTCTSSGGDYDPEDFPHRFECGYRKNMSNYNTQTKYKLIEANDTNYNDVRYYRYAEKIYVQDGYNVFKIVTGADASSFHCEDGLMKDKKNIYFDGKAITYADRKSCKSLNIYYCKDNKNVYHKAINDSAQSLVKIPNAHPSSFTIIGDQYSAYGKDSLSVFYNGIAIPNSDPESFTILNYSYSKDKNNVYYYGKAIEGMKGATFYLIADLYLGCDGNKICSGNTIFENSDVPTFEMLQCGYSRDKNNVYINGRILEGVDSKSFEILSWGFVKDKNAVYCDAQIIKGANPSTFTILGRKYSKDDTKVFYLQNIVDCDYSSFEVDTEKDYMAKDKNYIYKKGVKKLQQ